VEKEKGKSGSRRWRRLRACRIDRLARQPASHVLKALMPILQEIGVEGEPEVHPTHTFVSP
jgi:hypothetical protein